MLRLTYYWLRTSLAQKQRGATLVEYALIIAVIAIAVLVALGTSGVDLPGAITGIFGRAASELNTAGT